MSNSDPDIGAAEDPLTTLFASSDRTEVLAVFLAYDGFDIPRSFFVEQTTIDEESLNEELDTLERSGIIQQTNEDEYRTVDENDLVGTLVRFHTKLHRHSHDLKKLDSNSSNNE